MSLDHHIKILNNTLSEKQPAQFSPSWIFRNLPNVYIYIQKNIRTENNDIDWDRVTALLDQTFCKRWTRYRQRSIKPYEKPSEVESILQKYKDKLYTFIAYADESDKRIQNIMIISLVRLSQKGNLCAQEEVTKWITYITNDWIDRYPQMYRWKGYADEVEDKIKGCAKRYRYTGSLLGYLFKTLEYSARGKLPLISFDDKIFDGKKTRGEYMLQETSESAYG